MERETKVYTVGVNVSAVFSQLKVKFAGNRYKIDVKRAFNKYV